MSPKLRAYYFSENWEKLGIRVRKRDKCCVRCRSTKKLQVHHLTYKRIYKERMRDLILTCGKCHHNYYHRKAPLYKLIYYKIDETLRPILYTALPLTIAIYKALH